MSQVPTKPFADIQKHDIEFVSHEDLRRSAISLNDIFLICEVDEDEDKIDLALKEFNQNQISADELLDLMPPAADPILQRQGHTPLKAVAQKPFELHFAAQKGDLNRVKKLVELHGYDVNKEDITSTRPLYVAARYGHLEVVKYFTANGADVNDDCFDNDSALHVALEFKHYAIARHLVEQGANVHLMNNDLNSATNVLIKQYISIFEKSSEEIKDPKVIAQMLEIIETLDIFSQHCGDHFLYSTPIAGADVSFDLPVGYFLKNFASRAPTLEVRDKLIALADDLATFDTSEQTFDHAKNLLNTFPNNNLYLLDFEGHKTYFNGTGHFGHSSTKWASTSISAFYEHLQQQCHDPKKLAVFAKLAQTFEAATELKSNGELASYAQSAFERYESGETVVLGTGWKTHFIDVVLSKDHELFVTGNSGSRCQHIPPGLNFYHMNDTSVIDAKFMHDMTVNMNRNFFERDIMYQYELVEKIDEKLTVSQKFQNCTWVGHQHAIEACLYIELLNQGVEQTKAKTQAAQYYHEWEGFHGVFQIECYMKNNPGLPVQALTDIFKDVCKNMNKTNEAAKKAQAEKLCEALTSDHYRAEFKTWYNNEMKQSHAKAQEVKKLFEPYHVVEKIFDTQEQKEFAKHENKDGLGGFLKKLFGVGNDTVKTKGLPLQADVDAHHDDVGTDMQTVDLPIQVQHDPLVHTDTSVLSF
ncbi:MAG: ankyrin repeat domain-containing protein [Candidatus Berkiella sp.]